MTIPSEFTRDGLLPPGDYPATLDQIRDSILVAGVQGKRRSPHWDTAWRSRLVDNLEPLVLELNQVGISRIFIDGSFAEDKDHPNDIDGYFECEMQSFVSGEVARRLNHINPHNVWTWAAHRRRPYPGYAKLQLPMWHHYRVELWPHYGATSGIRDQYGNELTFPAAFRRSRISDLPRGIVQIVSANELKNDTK